MDTTEVDVLWELADCLADEVANFFAELNVDDENLSNRFSVRV